MAARVRRALTAWVLTGGLGVGCEGYVEGEPTPLTPAAPAPSGGPPPQVPVDDGGVPPVADSDAGGVPPVEGRDGGTDAGVRMLFVAVGHAGRTTVSCDDGLSWTANRSDMPELRCFSGTAPDGGSTDCDHNPGAGRGIAAGDGGFVANFGWGAPGSIRRSPDGVNWERVHEGPTFAAMVYGRGHFLAASGSPWVSADEGANWRRGGAPNLKASNVRRGGFGAGVFVLYGDGATRDWAVSADQGATWTAPASIPADCGAGQWAGGIEGNERVVLMLGEAVSCRSTDNGRTWTRAEVGGRVSSPLLWTGTEFMAWGEDTQSRPSVFRTVDGAAWSATPLQLRAAQADGGVSFGPGPRVGAVARGASGTFVAVNAGWQQWYEKQVFLRSTDGVTWEALPPQRYSPSHPITFIAAGPGRPGSACP